MIPFGDTEPKELWEASGVHPSWFSNLDLAQLLDNKMTV